MLKRIISIMVAMSVLCGATGCTFIANTNKKPQAQKITGEVEALTPSTIGLEDYDEEFVGATSEFAFELLKNCDTQEGNTLISPASVMLALGMTANGGAGETLEGMTNMLGKELNLDLINELYYDYMTLLQENEEAVLSIANSIWINNRVDMQVKKEFLTKCLTYYNAEIYTIPFDISAVGEVNEWVEDNTDGMIEKIIEEFNGDEVMVLINAIAFDAQWQKVYYENQVRDTEFAGTSGKKTVDGMYSEEDVYIYDENTVGFIKDYKGEYRFVALLPDEDVSIDEYVQGFTAKKYQTLMDSQKEASVRAMLPKFSYDYSISLNEALSNMGMKQAFEQFEADFSNMADCGENIYIGDVLHKTFIEVGEEGTRAAAVTAVIMEGNAMMPVQDEIHEVYLDRPFMYMIVDETTELPVFVGVVRDI